MLSILPSLLTCTTRALMQGNYRSLESEPVQARLKKLCQYEVLEPLAENTVPGLCFHGRSKATKALFRSNHRRTR